MILTPDQYPNLPKWPAAFVTGKSVTPEQAKEIIFRTDTSVRSASKYSIGGNDQAFRNHCQALFGWNALIALGDFPWELSNLWSEKMGMIHTEYVDNSFLSSAYIGGPHGWCNPNGQIYSEGHNYGKWPSVEEIVKDWMLLVEAFPYLDLVCTLYSGEQCEEHSVPVCSIVVKNGEIQVHSPDLSLHPHAPNHSADRLDNLLNIMSAMQGDYSSERGWPPEWVTEFGQKSTKMMQEVLNAHDSK